MLHPEVDFCEGCGKEIKDRLAENGYVVVRRVVSMEKVNEILKECYAWLKEASEDEEFDGNKPETWNKNADKWPIHTRGLIQHYNVAWQKFFVDARMEVKKVFEEIYGTKDLVSSFDSISVTRRSKTFKYKSVSDWMAKAYVKSIKGYSDKLHVDQTSNSLARCIQSGLAFIDQDTEDHVFTCVPKSHSIHEEVLGGKLDASEWRVMGEREIELFKQHHMYPVRVPLKAGDVVMWDSRTAHASSSYCANSKSTARRVQLFVCMKPSGDMDEKQRAIRKRAYEEGICSKHDPLPVRLFSKTPRSFSKPPTFKKMSSYDGMTMDERKLHGLM